VRPEAALLLHCPHCRGELRLEGRALRCARRHNFDHARQGYVNLVPAPGDTTAMVAAREAFLAQGHLDFVSAALAERAAALAGEGCVLDAGAGTAHHLAAVLEALPGRLALALDSSPAALRRAARVADAAVGCDLWAELPVRSEAAGVVLSVFSPRNGAEFARVLAPGGVVLVAAPRPGHLAELVAGLGLLEVDRRKPERLDAALGPRLACSERAVHRRRLSLTREAARLVARMGPSAWHLDPAELEGRLALLPDPLETEAVVEVSAWRRSPEG